jgi:glucosaminylphosphatidylinositol acyltransferase
MSELQLTLVLCENLAPIRVTASAGTGPYSSRLIFLQTYPEPYRFHPTMHACMLFVVSLINKNMATAKELKEEFVQGFEGTSPQELLLVCATAPIGLFFYNALASSVRFVSPLLSIVLEVVSFAIPMILCQSNLLHPWGVFYLGLQAIVGLLVTSIKKRSHGVAVVDATTDSPDRIRSALTVYRSAMLYLTFVAILAVDFRVFPRRFVKTEVRGYSLMDLGAASFVIAAGMVSPRARRTGMGNSKRRTFLVRTLPLIGMGILRLLTHKGIDYQEHASEYGVHWNFFFTLAMLAPVASFLPGPSWIVPTVVMAGYQYVLSYRGLQEWVEQAPRVCLASNNVLCNLFAANREGVLGIIGYAVLYLISEWIAFECLWRESSSSYSLASATCGVLATWRVLVLIGYNSSRRTTNAVFSIWALFASCAQLAAIMFVCEHSDYQPVPLLLSAANRNGLIVFVLANLMTGLVNISINTLEVDDSTALGVLFLYISAVSAASVATDSLLRRKGADTPKLHNQ